MAEEFSYKDFRLNVANTLCELAGYGDAGMNEQEIYSPSHYRSDDVYETIKVIEAWDLNYRLGNVIKYISRAGRKDQSKLKEDLMKARWYLDREISRINENE